jgi:hypothetical protein
LNKIWNGPTAPMQQHGFLFSRQEIFLNDVSSSLFATSAFVALAYLLQTLF